MAKKFIGSLTPGQLEEAHRSICEYLDTLKDKKQPDFTKVPQLNLYPLFEHPIDILPMDGLIAENVLSRFNSDSDPRTKFGERRIDLAVKGWSLRTNVGRGTPMVSEYSNQDEPTHIEDIAYAQNGKVYPDGLGVYTRSDSNTMNDNEVPKATIADAKIYQKKRAKSPKKALSFLLDVYTQVVSEKQRRSTSNWPLEFFNHTTATRRSGQYNTRFMEQDYSLAPTLNYFADKLRSHGREVEAERLEKAVNLRFPSLNPLDVPFNTIEYRVRTLPEEDIKDKIISLSFAEETHNHPSRP
jgi:hypothetical protein